MKNSQFWMGVSLNFFMAHRLARLMWILLQKNEYYRPIRSCNQVQGNV
ncbi:hypothetical protein PCIT_b1268 [Pseudoalteromonas citrea]|uniref:IS110 family transposase n=1 Tax=Pseudoalteromonas citrea TaxID=43655 RepID=A0AAD4AFS2_9GAMM|nr:hypothetical protein PCIT_b1268 [Pseudoalteromonas citrea]